MPYFKDTKNNNNIVYVADVAFAYLLPASCVSITDEQAAIILNTQTAEQIQSQLDAKNRRYLLDTDWYVIRFIEKGVSIPVDIGIARQLAREAIIGANEPFGDSQPLPSIFN